ncbi:hypothetical protein OQH61_09435, partial [Helicobacter sp. MIT 21-1697]|nr:hypothetical protein [Helicobacter sp. MIT 21-1697]
MGQWVSSKEFATQNSCEYEALKKACVRAYKRGKKICNLKFQKIYFKYANGHIGGNAGKVLRIWSEPFESEAAALAFVQAHAKEQTEAFISPAHTAYLRFTRDTNSTLQSHIKAQSSSEITTLTTPREIGALNENNKAFISSSESMHLGKSTNTYASDDRDTDDVLSALKQERYTHNLSAFDKASQKHKNIAL